MYQWVGFWMLAYLLSMMVCGVLFCLRGWFLIGPAGFAHPPNCAFWVVLIVCPPVGCFIALLRFLIIPVMKAFWRDLPTILSS